MQRSHRLFIRSAEGREIVPSFEHFCRRGHCLRVKFVADAERITLTQRTRWAVPDEVAVFPPLRAVAWLEASIHLAQPTKTDICRKQRTKRSLQLAPAEPAAVGECDHLLAGVDTSVGSTGTVYSDAGFTREPSQSPFELALDRPGSCLALEASKVSSVVFDPRAVTNGAALSGDLSGACLLDRRWPTY